MTFLALKSGMNTNNFPPRIQKICIFHLRAMRTIDAYKWSPRFARAASLPCESVNYLLPRCMNFCLPYRGRDILTRRWSWVWVLDLAKTAGGASLWQIVRHVFQGFWECPFPFWPFSETQTILCLKWTILNTNRVSFFSYSFLNISLI